MTASGKEVTIRRANNEMVRAISSIVVTASRSTDIPAFYPKWFINRLNNNYAAWINPFNGKTQYISFQNTRVFVFWTKNPKPLFPYLNEISSKGFNFYFQYTLNDYSREQLEPNVPSINNRIDTFIELSERIGKEKVIWRFDPLILTNALSVEDLLQRIRCLGDELILYTNKLVFSFADIVIYKKVQNNLKRETPYFDHSNIEEAELTYEQKIEFAEGMYQNLKEWQKVNPDFGIATCAEDINLEHYNIQHNKCIDDRLMIKLFPDDKKLMNFLGYYPETNLFGSDTTRKLKDKGQRTACKCIPSKDIGSYNTCGHLCSYCYANTSSKIVKKNRKSITEDSESLLPMS